MLVFPFKHKENKKLDEGSERGAFSATISKTRSLPILDRIIPKIILCIQCFKARHEVNIMRKVKSGCFVCFIFGNATRATLGLRIKLNSKVGEKW